MMLLNKLKAAALGTLVAFALTGGVGFGLLPAQAGDEPKATQVSPRRQPGESVTKATVPLDDATFLRRLTIDLTGVLPSRIEMDYFTADADAKKRAKVIDWLIADNGVKAALAKKLGVPVEQLAVVLALNDEDGATVIRRLRLTRAGALEAFDYKVPVNDPVAGGQFYYELANRRSPQPQAWFSSADGRVDLLVISDPPAAERTTAIWEYYRIAVESDADFLKKATESARGTAPTPLEEKYFLEDKDPKKREKLLDTLLKDPVVAKKLGDAWKKQMLEPEGTTEGKIQIKRYASTIKIRSLVVMPSKIEKLVDELIAAKKTDEQILEAITLAAASRLPTAEEKKSTLAVLGTLTDKKAAWVAIAKALAPAK